MKPWSKTVPDFYIASTDSWIIYPWEMREAISNLVRIWGKEANDVGTLKARLISAGIPEDMVSRYVPDKAPGPMHERVGEWRSSPCRSSK